MNSSASSKDPFADANRGDEQGVQDGLIHIRIQQRNGRKTLTTVQGIAVSYDKKKIVKSCKKEFACNGTVVEHPEYGEVIQLQGDQRNNICQFLTKMRIAKPEQLKSLVTFVARKRREELSPGMWMILQDDPHANANRGDGQGVQDELIHIRIQQRHGNKILTTVQGIADSWDKYNIMKYWKKKFACNGALVTHPQYGEVIQVQGDQHKKICRFLRKHLIVKPGHLRDCADSPLGISWSAFSITVLSCEVTSGQGTLVLENHLLGILERAISRWSPYVRGFSLVGRARAANSLVLAAVLHHLHGYLPATPLSLNYRPG
ncbi:EIF1B [Cordylochernes scorpioides]|uniref:EIF1B n=1 Tax=Cordylochernes scorpioides TaxID=51811 RepID=A0ABY6KQT4_9ARAC|nr:EIF1B [Cordylochernes scorpioides]